VENHYAESDHKHSHDSHHYNRELSELALQGFALVFAVESFLLTAESAYTARIARLDHYDDYEKYCAERTQDKARNTYRLEESPTFHQ
jgi:hypothetical protein